VGVLRLIQTIQIIASATAERDDRPISQHKVAGCVWGVEPSSSNHVSASQLRRSCIARSVASCSCRTAADHWTHVLCGLRLISSVTRLSMMTRNYT